MSSSEATSTANSKTPNKIVVGLVCAISAVLLVENAVRGVFWVKGRDPATFVLTRHDPGMKIGGRYTSAPFMPFDLQPNSEYEIVWTPPLWPELEGTPPGPYVWHIRHNSWGFRGPEVSLRKPQNTLRVLCLGGSTTYDTATDGQTWPEKLEKLLRGAYPDRRIEVLNLGMNASSMPFHITKFALFGVHFEPDLVIVYPGQNDLWSGIGLEGFRPDYGHRLGHWDDSRRTLQEWVPTWAMKSAAVTAAVVAIDDWRGISYDLVEQISRPAAPADDDLEGIWSFEAGLLTLQGIARAHGAEYLIVTPFWAFRKDDRKERLVQHIRQAATDAGIHLLDAADLIPAGDASLVIDDSHFSEKGGSLFASLIAEFVVANHLLP